MGKGWGGGEGREGGQEEKLGESRRSGERKRVEACALCFPQFGFTYMALPEVRMHMEGSSVVAGIYIDAIECGAIREPANIIQAVRDMSAENFLAVVAKQGFILRPQCGSIFCIPGSVIIVEFATGEQSVHGMRWCIVSETAVTRQSIGPLKLLHSYSEPSIADRCEHMTKHIAGLFDEPMET